MFMRPHQNFNAGSPPASMGRPTAGGPKGSGQAMPRPMGPAVGAAMPAPVAPPAAPIQPPMQAQPISLAPDKRTMMGAAMRI